MAATRVEAPLELVKAALQGKLDSNKRALNTPKNSNPLIQEILNKEIAQIQKAINSLREAK